MRREKKGLGQLRNLLMLAVAVIVFLVFSTAVNDLGRDSRAESKRQLEQAIRRSCVACYAAEGIYPPDLDYLKEHYGLQIDQETYVVHYDIFDRNLMPDITVLEVKK